MHGLLLATVSDNSAAGYNLTFAFPMALFAVVVGALYLVYSRPHRVPGHGPLRISRAGSVPGAIDPGRVPDAAAARAAATAAGPSTAAGGGSAESVHEAAGAQAASATTTSGSVSEDENQATGAGHAADQPAAPTDPAAQAPPNKDEASE